MKKFFKSAMFATLLTGISSGVFAQEGFSISVKATPQFSFLQNSTDNDNKAIEKEATFNAAFGVGAGYNFTENIGIGLDAIYGLQGQKLKAGGVKVHQKVDYLKVPLYFAYNTDPFKTVSFYGKIGPQINFLTNAKVSAGGSSKFVDNKSQFESVTFGGMANVGTQFRLMDNLFLQTGLYFDYDFTNAEDKDYSGYTPGRADTYNMNAGLQVGLKYRL